MSAIRVSDCLQPNRATASQRRLAALLARDEAPSAAGIIAGQTRKLGKLSQTETAAGSADGIWSAASRPAQQPPHREQPTPEDAFGPYTRAQLLRMNWRFVERIEQAFRNSTETREAAGASYQCEKFSDLPLNRIASPLW